ncbi:MAG: response regulator transcription factor [Oerskovia sp.]|nr:response regulator transcription factor [Oerskovia sp.]
MSVIRVALVDDHPVFRIGMAALLDSLDGVSVVAQAASAAEAQGVLGAPDDLDLVVMDLDLGDGSGVALTRDLVRAHPEVPVLVMTMHEDDDSVAACLRAGARGYLVKSASPHEVERAVRAVANGELILAPGVAARAVANVLGGARTAVPFPQLTDREREVLALVAAGLDNTAISRRLTLSTKTVRNYVAGVLAKLALRDRAAAIVAAREAGLVPDRAASPR